MIIWGSKYRETKVGNGNFECPTCMAEREYTRKRGARYFTLYFIPLFITETLGFFISCHGCNTNFNEEVLQYHLPSEQEKLAIAAYQDMAVGMPAQMTFRKLQNAGAAEDAAHRAVAEALGDHPWHCDTCNLDFIAEIAQCSSCGHAHHVNPTAGPPTQLHA